MLEDEQSHPAQSVRALHHISLADSSCPNARFRSDRRKVPALLSPWPGFFGPVHCPLKTSLHPSDGV